MKEEYKELLCLLKKAIATEDDGEPIKIADWGNLYRNATRQSVAAIKFDLLERKGENVVLPQRICTDFWTRTEKVTLTQTNYDKENPNSQPRRNSHKSDAFVLRDGDSDGGGVQ